MFYEGCRVRRLHDDFFSIKVGSVCPVRKDRWGCYVLYVRGSKICRLYTGLNDRKFEVVARSARHTL